jgi:hypothetical protein
MCPYNYNIFEHPLYKFAHSSVKLEEADQLTNAWRWMFTVYYYLSTVCGHIGGVFFITCDWVTHATLPVIRHDSFVYVSNFQEWQCWILLFLLHSHDNNMGTHTHRNCSLCISPFILNCNIQGLLLLQWIYHYFEITVQLKSRLQKGSLAEQNWVGPRLWFWWIQQPAECQSEGVWRRRFTTWNECQGVL